MSLGWLPGSPYSCYSLPFLSPATMAPQGRNFQGAAVLPAKSPSKGTDNLEPQPAELVGKSATIQSRCLLSPRHQGGSRESRGLVRSHDLPAYCGGIRMVQANLHSPCEVPVHLVANPAGNNQLPRGPVISLLSSHPKIQSPLLGDLQENLSWSVSPRDPSLQAHTSLELSAAKSYKRAASLLGSGVGVRDIEKGLNLQNSEMSQPRLGLLSVSARTGLGPAWGTGPRRDTLSPRPVG